MGEAGAVGKAILEPIIVTDDWSRDLARALISLIRAALFDPLMEALSDLERSDNAYSSPLENAIKDGTVRFDRGTFSGNISAAISKEIKAMGGKFVRGKWRLPTTQLTTRLQNVLNKQKKAMSVFGKLVERITGDLPERLRKLISGVDLRLYGIEGIERVSKKFKATVSAQMSVFPEITPEAKEKLKEEYFETTEKPIRKHPMRTVVDEFTGEVTKTFEDFSHEEVAGLRKDLEDMILGGSTRTEIKEHIQGRLKISARRCKFIARQETALLTTEFKRQRYLDVGIKKYKWSTVGDHKVRSGIEGTGDHKALDGRTFSWDNPPEAKYFSTGEPCHPGQDYNCRCVAKPIVEW